MSSTVPVVLGLHSYNIYIGAGLLEKAADFLAPFARGMTVPVVTDEIVAGLYLSRLLDDLRQSGIDASPLVLPAGEGTKSFPWLEKLCRDLVRLGVERNGLVVALGGGVIGDLVGFAAGILKRGVGFAQIPTTLLAQVDSSIGGKTAIDMPEGKNLVGLFHQPRIVIADTEVLSSLPRRQLLAGYAEVVKYGAIADADFFQWLNSNAHKGLSGEQPVLERMVADSCRMKSEIVSRDERETGDRALLNLGHTFGHALEAATGYSGRLLHGEAVAIGMVLAFRLSEYLGYSSSSDTEQLVRHLTNMGLPVNMATIPGGAPDTALVIDHMKHDKKAEGQRLRFVLIHALGRAFVCSSVPMEAVRAVLSN